MMERYYRFAGIEFLISMPEEMLYENEYRMEPFRVDHVTDPHRYSFRKVNTLTPPGGVCLEKRPDFCVFEENGKQIRYIGTVQKSLENAFLRVIHDRKQHEVQLLAEKFPNRIGTKIVLESMAAEHLIVQNGGVIFHCSYIDRDGSAVLFTAPSETGKSTQAELWRKYRGTDIINGDRTAVRIVDGTVMAEGVPFSGSSQYCKNRSLPVEAIVYLAQAPVTTVRKLRGYEAFSRIWEGVTVNTWDRMDVESASDTVKEIVQKIPVFYMPCTPDEAAVAALERELEKLVKE